MRIKITLNKEARESAKEMLIARGKSVPLYFEGPDFENVLSYDYDLLGIAVSVDGAKYFYPYNTIARVAIYG